MQKKSNPALAMELALVLLIVFQSVCAIFFIVDITGDITTSTEVGKGITAYLSVELFANIGLVAGIAVEAGILARLVRQRARQERTIQAATGALDDLMQDYFQAWGLTPSEIDVATFTIKGFSIAEIASLRHSAEGTVKSQLNSIYRKSGLAGRAQLVSILIEDLLGGPLPKAHGGAFPERGLGTGEV